jgi:hypothetical protein
VEEHATALAVAIEAALPRWIERSVRRLSSTADVEGAVAAAVAEVMPRLRTLLESDIDEQWTTPLELLRGAVRHPTAALRAVGVAPVARDDFVRERFPEDDYGLMPSSWSDVDEALLEPGIAWGAAKAWAHKQRHQS